MPDVKGQKAYLYRPSATRRPSGLETIRQSPSPSPNKYVKTQRGRFTVYNRTQTQKGRFTVIEPVKMGRFIVYYRPRNL